jgi:hypothetical protein
MLNDSANKPKISISNKDKLKNLFTNFALTLKRKKPREIPEAFEFI